MSQNLVSITITPEQQAAILAALDQLELLMKDLISLEAARRKRLRYMADKSAENVRATILTAAQNPEVMPRNFDIAEAQADLVAYDALMQVQQRMQRLFSRLTDTTMALGSDLQDAARVAYQQFKLTGDTHGLADIRKQLGERYAKQRSRTKAKK